MPGRRVRFHEYDVDFARRELRKSGVRVGLQHKPFRVLELLLRRPGELVTREELVALLWPDSHVSFERGLNTAVNSLRHVLGESSRDCRFIETRPGIGYRFCAPVEEVTEGDSSTVPPHATDKGADAYQDYLKGRYFLDRMCEEEVYKAIAFFRSAAAEETCRSLAQAGIADAYCQLALLGSAPVSQLVGPARMSAELALNNDPDLPEAVVAAGRVKMIFDWDWTGAREAGSRAVALDTSSVTAQAFQASLLCTLSNYEEAQQLCRRALALDPLSFPANVQFAACLYGARDFESAANQCWKILTLAPRFAPAQILLALAYERLGMYEEALVEFQNARSCVGFKAVATSGMGQVFGVTGLDMEAERMFVELSKQAESGYVSPYRYAVVCAGRRQEAQALSFLEESLRQRDPALLSLNADARLDALRGHEEFQTVLRRLGTNGHS
ncbi:MAG TPA: winged helix-turn-helix domain-containing protein [Bryobacteraceae bacterium]|jgi:DNA-binding winged helix-turn-helix (wHTH) protein/Tfp pilus assembly protein PilF|nr:winged helix-turn-helix domain-containing protein [Bryobacteraceae bacterium]